MGIVEVEVIDGIVNVDVLALRVGGDVRSVGEVGRSVGVTIFYLSSHSVLMKLRTAMFHPMTSSR